jgi:hypothetical protein
MIDRSQTRDIPKNALALKGRNSVRNSRCGKPSWPAAIMRPHKQAGHMIASDPIRLLLNHLARRRPSTYAFWGGLNRSMQHTRMLAMGCAVGIGRGLPNYANQKSAIVGQPSGAYPRAAQLLRYARQSA